MNINDIFWTIQGEGFNTGRRALFIRLPFCNYKCPWCDTEFDSYNEYENIDLINWFEKEPARFAVITGGEPTMNKYINEIITLLKAYKFEIALETNGSFPIPDGIDHVTCSPKKYVQKGLPEYFINPSIRNKISEVKYVVDEIFDFSILDKHKDDKFKKYLSPEFNNFEININRILKYIKENPEWKVSLQTHKLMKIQ